MKIGQIEVEPLASESMGVRSLCTRVRTPDVEIVFDPSAALAMRFRLEPHPYEYRALLDCLQKIFVAARKAHILCVSHYHYDHCRPGFTDFRYNLSSREELQRMFESKKVFAKDNRENINPSQRRRGFYFEKDIGDLVEELKWCDKESLVFGNTEVICSHPLPHGPTGSRLGYVIATTVMYDDVKFLFAPDVQGPVDLDSLTYLCSMEPDLAIIGGPPIYLHRFEESERAAALTSLEKLASITCLLVVDHHLMRSSNWFTWLQPVRELADSFGHRVATMAELAGLENTCLEADREQLYESSPPSQQFMDWTTASDEFKKQNLPPL